MLPKLDLNVTNRCNYRCAHCAFESGEWKLEEFSAAKLEEILRETKELGGRRIDITGGEPTIRKDLEELVRIAKKLGYETELVTNGSLLAKERLQRLKNEGLSAIAVSLDGSNYETYSRIRRASREEHARAIETIKNAVSLGLYTKINTTVFASNYQDIPNITEFGIKLGISEHGLYYFTPVGRGKHGGELSVEPVEWLDFMRKELMQFDSKIKISTETPVIEKELLQDKLTECIADNGRNHLHVLPDGKVYPCAILASYRKPLADLNTESIKKVWGNEKLWSDYWKDARKLFCSNYCVKFDDFDMSKYTKDYKFVCPLRKFRLGEIAK